MLYQVTIEFSTLNASCMDNTILFTLISHSTKTLGVFRFRSNPRPSTEMKVSHCSFYRRSFTACLQLTNGHKSDTCKMRPDHHGRNQNEERNLSWLRFGFLRWTLKRTGLILFHSQTCPLHFSFTLEFEQQVKVIIYLFFIDKINFPYRVSSQTLLLHLHGKQHMLNYA